MLREGILMGIIVFISRISGFFRAFLVAYYFGASEMTDAFYSAFKISNFFRQLLGEGALGSSFIPLYNERVEKEGKDKSKQFIFSVLNILFIFSTVITILMIVFSDGIIDGIVGGFAPSTKLLSSKLLKIMAVYFIFISLSGMIGAILNNFKQFAIPASTSIFFNLAIIVSAILLGKEYGIYALAFGVVIGGLLQFLIVLPSFFRILKTYSFRIDWKDPYLKKLFFLICPMLFGIVARQLNTLVDQMFASHLDMGAVTALENATRLYLLPVGVFGVSMSTVIFPSLSQAVAKNQIERAKQYVVKGLNILLFLVVPSIAVLTIFSKDVVEITLSYGRFGQDAVRTTSSALLYYSLGLYFYTGIFLITRAFYSVKDSKNPVRYSVISIAINIVLNFALVGPLGYRGLALSTSIASGVNFICLLYVFRKQYMNFDLGKTFKFLIKSIIISMIAVGVSYKIEYSIVKILVFGIVYMGFWARSLAKHKLEVF